MDVKGIDTLEAAKTQMPLWLILKMKIYNITINVEKFKTCSNQCNRCSTNIITVLKI